MIQLIIVLILLGLGMYLVNKYVPMAPPIKTLVNVFVFLVAGLWMLNALGILHATGMPRAWRLR